LFIGGEWLDAVDGATMPVDDPASGEIVCHVADAGQKDALLAESAAVQAQEEWAATAPRARSEILRRAYEIIVSRADDLALLMTTEMGKPLAEAKGEVAAGDRHDRPQHGAGVEPGRALRRGQAVRAGPGGRPGRYRGVPGVQVRGDAGAVTGSEGCEMFERMRAPVPFCVVSFCGALARPAPSVPFGVVAGGLARRMAWWSGCVGARF
jgi:hypothetical protein